MSDQPKPSKDQLAELEQKCAEYLSGWQRARADYVNLQKNTAEERAEWVKFANEDVLMEILPIYDHLKLAWVHIPDDQKKLVWVVGIEHIKNQFAKFLADQGIEEIKTVGEKFNPEAHEAQLGRPQGSPLPTKDAIVGAGLAPAQDRATARVAPTPAQSEAPAQSGDVGAGLAPALHDAPAQDGDNQMIKQEIKAGYKLHGKVLVAAKVMV